MSIFGSHNTVMLWIALLIAACQCASVPLAQDLVGHLSYSLGLNRRKEMAMLADLERQYSDESDSDPSEDGFYRFALPKIAAQFVSILEIEKSSLVYSSLSFRFTDQEKLQFKSSVRILKALDAHQVAQISAEILLASRRNLDRYLRLFWSLPADCPQLIHWIKGNRIEWTPELVHLLLQWSNWKQHQLEFDAFHSVSRLCQIADLKPFVHPADRDDLYTFDFKSFVEVWRQKYAEFILHALAPNNAKSSVYKQVICYYNLQQLLDSQEFISELAQSQQLKAATLLHHQLGVFEQLRSSSEDYAIVPSHIVNRFFDQSVSNEAISQFRSLVKLHRALVMGKSHKLLSMDLQRTSSSVLAKNQLSTHMIKLSIQDDYWKHLIQTRQWDIYFVFRVAMEAYKSIDTRTAQKHSSGDNFLRMIEVFSSNPASNMTIFAATLSRAIKRSLTEYCFFYYQVCIVVEQIQRRHEASSSGQQQTAINRMTVPEYWQSLSNPSISYSEQLFGEHFGVFSLMKQWKAGAYELTLLQMYLSTCTILQEVDLSQRLFYWGMSSESIAAFEAVKRVFGLNFDNTMETAGLIVQCLMLDHMITTKSLNIASVLPFIVMCSAGRRVDLPITSEQMNQILHLMSSFPWFIKRLSSVQTEHFKAIETWYNTAFFDYATHFVLDRGNVLHLKLSLILEMLLATTDPRFSAERTFLDLLMRRLYEASNPKTADGIRRTMIDLDYSPFVVEQWNGSFPLEFQVSFDDLASFMIDTLKSTRTNCTPNSAPASPVHGALNVTNALLYDQGANVPAVRGHQWTMYHDWFQDEEDYGEAVQGVYVNNVQALHSDNDNSNNNHI